MVFPVWSFYPNGMDIPEPYYSTYEDDRIVLVLSSKCITLTNAITTSEKSPKQSLML